MAIRSVWMYCGLALFAGFAPASAQDENPTTPGAIPNPGTYQGSMQLQQQERQQYQQQEQQNQQMQQRLDHRQYAPGQRGGSGGPPPVNWWGKPALPPARNPLLGRWRQIASRQAQNPLAALLGGMLAGGCQSIFGKGVVAFEPNALQWVAPDGHEEILNHVAYRANGQDVVMISRDPGAIPALSFGFPNRDHALVGGFNCSMERLGAKPQPSVASTVPVSPSSSPAARSGPANAVLNFDIGTAAPGTFTPLASIQIWVTREDPETSLMRAGFPHGPAPLAERLSADCRNPANCIRDWKAMTSTALGSIRTDAAGHARTPPVRAGRYYLVGFAPGQRLFWRRPVNLQPGSNSVMLDQTNASLLH